MTVPYWVICLVIFGAVEREYSAIFVVLPSSLACGLAVTADIWHCCAAVERVIPYFLGCISWFDRMDGQRGVEDM